MRLAATVFVSGTDDTAALLAALRDEGFDTGRSKRVTYTVLDTIDGRLHVNGLRLVAAQADTLSVTLAGPGRESTEIVATSIPIRATDLPDGPGRDIVHAASGERLLLAQATVVAMRTVASLSTRSGQPRALVTIDEKLHLSGRRKALASRVTVHRVAGRGKVRRRVESLCAHAGLVEHADVMGEVLEQAGIDLTGVSRSPADLNETTLAIDGFRSVLRDLFVAVEGYWRAAAQSSDPAVVHGLRVATRRSRSVQAEGRTVLPREAQSMASAGLGLLGACTGPARDLDVYLAEWNGYVAGLPARSAVALMPVRDLLEARRAVAHRDLAVGLASPAMKDFVRDWARWLRKPVAARTLARSADSGRLLTDFIIERIEGAHLTLLEHGRLISDESLATQLHDLRRDAKRLRYLLECFGELFPAKAMKPFVRRLKSLQDNLGVHQDTEVHAAQLVALLAESDARDLPEQTIMAAQLLVQHLQQRTAGARMEFSARFADYDSPATHSALQRILVVEPT